MNRIENIFGIMPDQANQCQHSIWIGLISEKNANIIIIFLFIIQRKTWMFGQGKCHRIVQVSMFCNEILYRIFEVCTAFLDYYVLK